MWIKTIIDTRLDVATYATRGTAVIVLCCVCFNIFDFWIEIALSLPVKKLSLRTCLILSSLRFLMMPKKSEKQKFNGEFDRKTLARGKVGSIVTANLLSIHYGCAYFGDDKPVLGPAQCVQ